MVNKFKSICAECGAPVPAQGGTLTREGSKWVVRHLACGEGRGPQVHYVRTSSGWEGSRNVNGRCEDAPCCGCCTY
jgi:hypothetical protein